MCDSKKWIKNLKMQALVIDGDWWWGSTADDAGWLSLFEKLLFAFSLDLSQIINKYQREIFLFCFWLLLVSFEMVERERGGEGERALFEAFVCFFFFPAVSFLFPLLTVSTSHVDFYFSINNWRGCNLSSYVFVICEKLITFRISWSEYLKKVLRHLS